MLERLEHRRLFSTSLVNGLLTVGGTSKNDAITFTASTKRLYVQVNAQDASFRLSSVKSILVHGNRGHDSIHLGAITIRSTLMGAGGNDKLIGGAGNDVLIGGGSSDLLVGGIGGTDTADYSDHTTALVLSIGGGYNDGADGENDNIGADVENIVGGQASDRITGNGSANVLQGGHRNDRIYGRGGEDSIFGNAGDDYLDGGHGNDSIVAGNGDNYLGGGAGDDTLDAHNGETNDSINGGDGHDFCERDRWVSSFGVEYGKDNTDLVEERENHNSLF